MKKPGATGRVLKFAALRHSELQQSDHQAHHEVHPSQTDQEQDRADDTAGLGAQPSDRRDADLVLPRSRPHLLKRHG